MYASWQEYLNDFKALCFPKRTDIAQHRFSLGEDELQHHWDSHTLTQLESIFTITDQYALNFLLSQLLPHYLNSRKSLHQIYTVSMVDENNQEQVIIYAYDCKLFKGNLYAKQENEFISSFLLLYREECRLCPDSIYEVVSPDNLGTNRWTLKVKESCILRVFGYLKDTMGKMTHKNDKIVLQHGHYQSFLQQWLKCYYNYNMEVTVGYFFRSILVLLQNQIMLSYLSTLSFQQRQERKYLRPIKMIDKPRNIEQFTLTEGSTETEIKWQTLKITTFKLKYRIVEESNNYECFMIQEELENQLDFEALDEEDQKIVEVFRKVRKTEEEYSNLYV